MAGLKCERAADGKHLWTGKDMPEGARLGSYCRCALCADIGCVSMRLDEKWVNIKMQDGIYTTKVKGSDGVVYDLALIRFLPTGVLAVNAWTEKVAELPELTIEQG